MLKVICFCFHFALLQCVIGLKNLAPLSQPIRSKHQNNHDLLTCDFPRLRRLHLFALSSDWFPVVLASVVTVRVITLDLIQVTQLKTVLLINPILFIDEHFLSFWYSALINLPKM